MKKIYLSLLAFLIGFSGIAQSTSDFTVGNGSISPAPAVFPGGKETINFDFKVSSPFTFNSDDLNNDYGSITFSFTKLDPTGIMPSGNGAALFNWVLSDNGGTGVNKVYTYSGGSKTVTMNKIPTVYKITFVDVPVTFASISAQPNIKVAGQFTAPGNAGGDLPANNFAFVATYSQAPLPIILSEFTAVSTGCTAALNWKTFSESNSAKFEVEVSTNNGDKFATVSNVAAAGNSSNIKSYGYTYSMQSGVTYLFRLKSVDKDGSFAYSDSRKVSCSNNNSAKIFLSPNPVTETFELQGLSAGKNKVAVYSATGQMVAAKVINEANGSMNISKLAAGMYIVKITDQEGVVTNIKVIKN